jgi:Swi5
MSISDASNSGDDPEKIIERHIKLLHDYNESKDAAQVLLDVMHDTDIILTPPTGTDGEACCDTWHNCAPVAREIWPF